MCKETKAVRPNIHPEQIAALTDNMRTTDGSFYHWQYQINSYDKFAIQVFIFMRYS
jgi:hypothetical protein